MFCLYVRCLGEMGARKVQFDVGATGIDNDDGWSWWERTGNGGLIEGDCGIEGDMELFGLAASRTQHVHSPLLVLSSVVLHEILEGKEEGWWVILASAANWNRKDKKYWQMQLIDTATWEPALLLHRHAETISQLLQPHCKQYNATFVGTVQQILTKIISLQSLARSHQFRRPVGLFCYD